MFLPPNLPSTSTRALPPASLLLFRTEAPPQGAPKRGTGLGLCTEAVASSLNTASRGGLRFCPLY